MESNMIYKILKAVEYFELSAYCDRIQKFQNQLALLNFQAQQISAAIQEIGIKRNGILNKLEIPPEMWNNLILDDVTKSVSGKSNGSNKPMASVQTNQVNQTRFNRPRAIKRHKMVD